ncbi:hypothetical protein SAMN05421774_101670 [Gemmobacter megaterium]|uniref:Uncharacterized protein n=1 Tax=Gemmobacter megaterium TaxID=1086013 RepID=A0A1N7KTI8_9RHOB|nr:hypothetical protein [Gemmobacter megaterium]GGE03721.1 hypothetical protein GCM10011345_06550 [Gemmobacter megaterium]SIS64909.1 hypothetical protein SAMN05421774_101670 [Gemmobacter megaterium]
MRREKIKMPRPKAPAGLKAFWGYARADVAPLASLRVVPVERQEVRARVQFMRLARQQARA